MTAVVMKELRAYFSQMTGYIFLALTTLLVGLFFTFVNVFALSPGFHQVLNEATLLFLIMIPALTMRLFADESRNKTDQLLYTSPLTIWQIVLGKYLAAALLFLMGMAITVLFPVMMSFYGDLPLTQIIGAYLGFILMGFSFIGLGLLISVTTENQIIAAVATFGTIFAFFLMDVIASAMPADATSSLVFVIIVILIFAGILYNGTKNIFAAIILMFAGIAGTVAMFFINNLLFDGLIVRMFRWLSMFSRFDSLSRGVLNISDVVFYLTFSLLLIYLTINFVEKRRWR